MNRQEQIPLENAGTIKKLWLSILTYLLHLTHQQVELYLIITINSPQRGKNASGGDSSEYHLINTSDPMNTSNSFRPNFLLDFENGEAYFGAGGIHLAADSENSQLQLTTSDTKHARRQRIKYD